MTATQILRTGAPLRRAAALLCLLSAACTLHAQNGNSIEGQVLNAVTGVPLRNVEVTLRLSMIASTARSYTPPTAITNEQGRFAFDGLDAGGYAISLRRQGFIDMARPPIILGEGQSMRNLVARMPPHSVIAGKVVDADGEPAMNAQVIAVRWDYSGGVRQLTRVSGFTTNDLGEYRVAGLAAGSYLVLATPARIGRVIAVDQPLDKPEEIYAPTFYPGAIDASAARSVTVAAGAEARTIDIKLRKSIAVEVRGRAMDSGAVPNGNLSVTLRPRAAILNQGAMSTAYTNASDVFVLRDVLPGSYDILLRKSNGTATVSGVLSIEVSDKNLGNLTVRLSPVAAISGVIRSAPAGRCLGSIVTLNSATPGGGVGTVGTSAADSFTLKDVQAGSYRLDVRPPGNCYLQAVSFNGRDILGAPFNVEGGGSLEIFLAETNGSVRGYVRDAAGKPAARAVVTLTPRGGAPSSFRQALSLPDGGFSFSYVAPGIYDAFAWQSVNINAAQAADYIKEFATLGKQVTVSAAGGSEIQLTVVPASATGGQPPDPPGALGSLEGQVVSAADGSPVPEATVLLTKTGAVSAGTGNSFKAETDAQGKFAIRDLDPAAYFITAQRRGFTRVEMPGGVSQRLVIGDGQRLTGFTLKMNPQGVLSGKVKDEYGEAVGNANVIAYRAVAMMYGGRRLVRAGTAMTDDLGQFRIADAPPGTYYLSATRRMPPRTLNGVPQTPAGPPETGFGIVWYPSAAGFEASTPVIAKAGDVPNLDFVFRRTQLFRIRGTVKDPAGTPDQRLNIGVEPRGLGIGASTVGNAILGRDGTFEIAGVPPGSYTLTARTVDGPAVRMASMPLEVRDASIQGVALELAGAREIRGMLRVDGGAGYMTVVLMCASGRTAQSTRASTDGAFTIPNLLPDVCSLNVTNLTATSYVKSVRYGGAEASPGMVDFSAQGELEIAVGANAASLDGVAVGRDGKPAPGAAVYLLSGVQADAVRTVAADNMGRFYFANLRPGAYNIYAWENGGPDGTRESLAQSAAPGKPVTLGENGRQSVQVSAIQPR